MRNFIHFWINRTTVALVATCALLTGAIHLFCTGHNALCVLAVIAAAACSTQVGDLPDTE